MKLHKTSKYNDFFVVSVLIILLLLSLAFFYKVLFIRDIIIIWLFFAVFEIVNSVTTYDIKRLSNEIQFQNMYKITENSISEIAIITIYIRKRGLAFIMETNKGSYKINYTKKNYNTIKSILESKAELDKLNRLNESVNKFFFYPK